MGKIIEETMLTVVDIKNNSNKFYHVTLDDGGTVTKRWGRVGVEGTSSTEQTGFNGYERAVNSKKKKGYQVAPIVHTGVTVTGNSTDHLEEVAQKYLAKDSTDTTITDLIQRLVKANQHQIMEQSGGLIKVTNDGTVKTALGVVDLSTINTARTLLTRIQNLHNNTSGQVTLLEEYLRLIPQKVGYRRGWEDDFLTVESLGKQVDFLKQLEDAVKWGNSTKTATADPADNDADKFDITKHADMFRFKLDKLDNNSAEFKRIEKLYQKTRNNMHTSRHLRLINVFAVEDVKGKADYDVAKGNLGNVKEFWHGTKASNLLSILTKGLFVPNAGSGVQIQGRMFGDGVYFSDQSTKSLNYATGYWNGTNTNQNVFMLLNDVVMGNEFRPSRWDSSSLHKAHKGADNKGKPFNSINIQGGTCNVRNNEMIIWDTRQICIKYVCEFGS